MSSLILGNVRVKGRRTSVRLERDMWDALSDICAREEVSLEQICAHVADTNGEPGFTSSLRVFIINYYRGRGRPVAPPAARGRGPQHQSQIATKSRSGRAAKVTRVDSTTMPATSSGARLKRCAKR